MENTEVLLQTNIAIISILPVIIILKIMGRFGLNKKILNMNKSLKSYLILASLLVSLFTTILLTSIIITPYVKMINSYMVILERLLILILIASLIYFLINNWNSFKRKTMDFIIMLREQSDKK